MAHYSLSQYLQAQSWSDSEDQLLSSSPSERNEDSSRTPKQTKHARTALDDDGEKEGVKHGHLRRVVPVSVPHYFSPVSTASKPQNGQDFQACMR